MIPNLPFNPNSDLQQLNIQLAALMQELQFLLIENIDDTNIANNGISASKLNIAQLAQIVADLGTITAGVLQNVQITTAFTNITDGVATLQAQLAAKANIANTTGNNTHDHGIPNGTVLMVNGGGTVTFNSNTHSHTQQ
jgi:hypothetical protein